MKPFPSLTKLTPVLGGPFHGALVPLTRRFENQGVIYLLDPVFNVFLPSVGSKWTIIYPNKIEVVIPKKYRDTWSTGQAVRRATPVAAMVMGIDEPAAVPYPHTVVLHRGDGTETTVKTLTETDLDYLFLP